MVQLTSILDNDFYKFTMQQCVVKLFPKAKARYSFINRGRHVFTDGFAEALRSSVASMSSLKLAAMEKSWLGETCPTSIRFILIFYRAIAMILPK